MSKTSQDLDIRPGVLVVHNFKWDTCLIETSERHAKSAGRAVARGKQIYQNLFTKSKLIHERRVVTGDSFASVRFVCSQETIFCLPCWQFGSSLEYLQLLIPLGLFGVIVKCVLASYWCVASHLASSCWTSALVLLVVAGGGGGKNDGQG